MHIRAAACELELYDGIGCALVFVACPTGTRRLPSAVVCAGPSAWRQHHFSPAAGMEKAQGMGVGAAPDKGLRCAVLGADVFPSAAGDRGRYVDELAGAPLNLRPR